MEATFSPSSASTCDRSRSVYLGESPKRSLHDPQQVQQSLPPTDNPIIGDGSAGAEILLQKRYAIAHPIGTAASIIFYRDHQDALVHAIATEVWQGSNRILAIQPIH
jgi:hypothetical protein